jgi:hypothetical protein
MMIILFAIHSVAMHFKQIGAIVSAQGYTVPASGSKYSSSVLQHVLSLCYQAGTFTIRLQ